MRKLDLDGLMPAQREIVTTFDRPVFVSAGAGSGKTFTLTRRILMALSEESGPVIEGMDQVLAITFTKDAAAELRDRVRKILYEYGRDEDALGVGAAAISTIHGMCSEILRAHAFELKIDPDFKVIEDAEVDELLDRAYNDAIAAAGADADPHAAGGPYSELFSWCSVKGYVDDDGNESGTTARSIVCTLAKTASLFEHGIDDVSFVRGRTDLTGLADACRAYLDEVSGARKRPAGAAAAEATLAAIAAFEASNRGKADVIRLMYSISYPRATKATKELTQLIRAEAADALVNAYLAASKTEISQLERLARETWERFGALKDGLGALDNNDLLRRAHDALATHPEIREAYDRRFRLVMIDEFQDTDQLQIDLVSMLTGEGDRKLCTVGDAQQSIYRFRGADVEVFRNKEDDIAGGAGDSAGGALVRLTRNFRSHAGVLAYVSQVFDDERGGIMPGFLDLEPNPGHTDALVPGASRAQAVLTVGGSREERRAASAAAIARRLRALADAGQSSGDMVILLGGMTHADVYADAVRAEGLDCIISGGSVFSSTTEARTIQALLRALANPLDVAPGLLPVLASPMFSLGAEELLALATKLDADGVGWSRRNLDRAILSDEGDVPELAALPLVRRAREVLRGALSRVGREPVADIVRDAVLASGWLARLEDGGAEGRAAAANVLKAMDMVAEIGKEAGSSPRRTSLAFDRALLGKQAPGALNGAGGDAVRIMTVHASKGREFPVVAVAECFDVRRDKGSFQFQRTSGGARAVVLPTIFESYRADDGSSVPGRKVQKAFSNLCSPKLFPGDLIDQVCPSDSALGAFLTMRSDEAALALQERARLLYVAMTRAEEAVILALDASITSREKSPVLVFDDSLDLTGRVLARILPDWPSLAADRLALEDSVAGDFELQALVDFAFEGASYTANVAADDEGAGLDVAGDGADAGTAGTAEPREPELEEVELVYPAEVAFRAAPAAAPPRASWSYTSVARELKAASEDRSARPAPSDGDPGEPGDAGHPDGTPDGAPAEDPTALGSAFHAAAQWLIETGEETVPTSRVDALARAWHITDAQRARLECALARWEGSSIRAEMRSWPDVLAEVPFYSLGMDGFRERFGEFAEGAIDVLCLDPARPDEALVLDYKTGGRPDEGPRELHEKHALQARVYADVLHRAGYARVHLAFVRVEVDDARAPGEPEVVRYEDVAGA